jgi:hypothetical protein
MIRISATFAPGCDVHLFAQNWSMAGRLARFLMTEGAQVVCFA